MQDKGFKHEAPLLCKTRSIELFGPVDEEMALRAVSALRVLAQDKPGAEITLDVMSRGGDVHAGLAIIDAARNCGCPIRTVGMGICASMGATILACAGDRGLREIMPNAEVMVHQVMSGMQGQQTDIEIQAAHTKKLRERLDCMLAKACGKSAKHMHKITERNSWFCAEEALAFGLADSIVGQENAGSAAAER